MFERRTAFKAAQHGFRFRNRFDLLPEFRLPGGITFDPGEVIIGLCGGMCFTALDYYHQGLAVPGFDDEENLPAGLMKALQRRQGDSTSLSVLKKLFNWILKSDGEVSRLTAWREFPKLRQKLDSGEPAVLMLVNTHGLQKLEHNHQVLATGYRFDALTRQAEISIYNPNHPGREGILSVNLARAAQGLDLHQPGGEASRGFFVQPYHAKRPPELNR